MGLQLCVLGSGSGGNCIYIASPLTRVLIDVGLSCAGVKRALAQLSVELSDVHAVCLTHEHVDHRNGLPVLHRRTGALLFANSGTISGMERDERMRGLPWQMFSTGHSFQIGDLTFEPFSVPHDSYDPVGFVIRNGASCAGIVTDMGMVTTLIRERLRACQALVIESNHDEDLLRQANRPWPLIQRILGMQGHLSNAQAAELLASIAGPHLKAVLLAHLSSDCNKPHLAERAARQALERAGQPHVRVLLTHASQISELVEV
jgi:phosphoribosyl 1,2-cyclic phosphodiesterase